MSFKSIRLLALAPALLLVSVAHAQVASTGWQAKADLASAGAGAHVAVQHLCRGAAASQQATTRIDSQLRRVASDLVGRYGQDVTTVQTYLVEATNTKIKAFLAANQGVPCKQLGRLAEIAEGAGFPLD